MARPRRKPGQESNRRAELLRAAARLFVRQGFHATTTRDIARETGMRSGSPFYHFVSKQALLKAVMVEGIENGLDRLEKALAGAETDEARLRCLIRTHLDILLDAESPAPMMINDWRALDDADSAEVAAAFDRYQAPWQTVMSALASRGLLGSGVPTARLLLIGMLNWLPQWYRSDGPCDLDEITETAFAMLLRRG